MTKDTSPALRFNQIALSVRDRDRTLQWYADVLGYVPAGELVPAETIDDFETGDLQGIPGARTSMSWAVDQQRFFQLEFFQYEAPEVRPLPADWSVNDVGYSVVLYYVDDFDGTLDRAIAAGAPPLTDPLGEPGARRVCFRDPDGILIEIAEADPRTPEPDDRPRPSVNVAARAIRASVPDLARSRRFFVDTLGMTPSDVELHAPEHEALWGLAGAKRTVETVWAGDLWLELVQYEDPKGSPLPADYRISDQGILNIALGTRSPETFQSTVNRVRANGYDATPEFMSDAIQASYSMDDQGFSVELWFVDEAADPMVGFVPMVGEVTW